MRSFPVLLGATIAVLACPAATPDAQAADALDKITQLKRGMTYEEVLSVMGREPEVRHSTTTGDGTVMMVYAWWNGKDYLRTFFMDDRLAAFGPVFMDHSLPPPPKQ
jgi:hypothetical protein